MFIVSIIMTSQRVQNTGTDEWGLSRVLEYLSTTRAVNYTRVILLLSRVLVTFNFRLQISISGCSFCTQLMNCWNLWKLGGSGFHLSTCQPGNRPEYVHVEGMLVQGHDPAGRRYADPLPVLRHWQLVLKYFRYSSTQVLVKALGRVLE